MAIFVKQVQKGGDNSTQIQIGSDGTKVKRVHKDSDTVICDIATWLKTMAVMNILVGTCWFGFGLIRMVILDIYHRCEGTWWETVFWVVVCMHVLGYMMAMLGCLLYEHHKPEEKTVDINPCGAKDIPA